MPSKKFIVQFIKRFAIYVILLLILGQFVGQNKANLLLVIAIFIHFLGETLMGYVRSNRPSITKVLPPTDNIPDALKEYDSALSSLDFVHVNTTMAKDFQSFIYWNDTQDIIVAFSGLVDTKVKFSTYLADGFYVATDYPMGVKREAKKISRHIVTSTLEAAFEYHQHHVQQQTLEHGVPKQFEAIEEIINWEDQNNLRRASHSSNVLSSVKFFLRYVVGVIVAFIIWYSAIIAIQFGLGYFGFVEMLTHINWISNVVLISSFIICGIWAFKPMYKPETVEDRKKKEFA